MKRFMSATAVLACGLALPSGAPSGEAIMPSGWADDTGFTSQLDNVKTLKDWHLCGIELEAEGALYETALPAYAARLGEAAIRADTAGVTCTSPIKTEHPEKVTPRLAEVAGIEFWVHDGQCADTVLQTAAATNKAGYDNKRLFIVADMLAREHVPCPPQ